MSIFEQIASEQDSEQFLSGTLEQKIQANHNMLGVMQASPEYLSMSFEQRKDIDKKMLSRMPGYDPAAVIGDGAVADRSRELLMQAESFKTGQADINAWDGIKETASDYLLGKVTTGFVDVFVDGDVREAIFGDKNQELEEYRNYVASVNSPEGMADYKFGKGLGHVIGFGADAAAMAALYGSVGAPGVVAKMFGSTGGKIFSVGMTKAQKVGALVPKLFGQALLETTGFIGETALADAIIGELDSNTTVNEWLATVPSTAKQGLMYFTFGEAFGAGIGGMLKGLGKIYTKKGFQTLTAEDLIKMGKDEVNKGLIDMMANGKISKATKNSWKSVGYEPEQILRMEQDILNGLLIVDAKSLGDNPNALAELNYKVLYKMDTKVKGEVVEVYSFGGKKIETAHIKSEEEMMDFLVDRFTDVENANMALSKKLASSRTGDVSLEVSHVGGTSITRPIDNTLDLFGIHRKTEVPIEQYDAVVKEYLGADTKVKVLKMDKEAVPIKDAILIPRYVKSQAQSAQFTREFFQQIADNSNGKLKFDTKPLERLMRTGSNVEYGEKFLKENIGVGGEVKIDPLNQTVFMKLIHADAGKSYDNVHQASAALHRSKFSNAELQDLYAKKRGATLEYGPKESLTIMYGNNKPEPDVKTGIDLFLNEKTRPSLPYGEREVFLGFAEPQKNITQQFEKGTIPQLLENIKKYEKSNPSAKHLVTRKSGGVSKEVGIDRFTVLHEDTGFTREFLSLKDAVGYLDEGITSYKDLEASIEAIGWRLQPAKGGGYSLRTPGQEVIFARTLKEAETKVANAENIFNIRETLEDVDIPKLADGTKLSEEFAPVIQKNAKALQRVASKYKGFGENRLKQVIDRWTKPIRSRLEKTGDPSAISLGDKAFTANRLFHNKFAETVVWSKGLFHGKGRAVSHDQMTQMGKLLGAEVDPALWPKTAKELGLELTDDHFQIMGTLRTAMDVLGAQANIKPDQWIKHYWTRLKEMTHKEFSEVLQTNRSGLSDPWFRHLRTEDYISAQFDDNVEAMFGLYAKNVYREVFLKDVMQEMTDISAAALKDSSIMNPVALQLLEDINEKVIGNAFSSDTTRAMTHRILSNQKAARKIIDAEGRFAKWTPEKRAEAAKRQMQVDWTRFSNDVTTAALMAFKMKLPLRNASQVITILSNLSGMEEVGTAMKQLGDNKFGADMYMEGVQKGIIKVRQGKTYDHPAAMNLIKNWNEIGMNNFYHSDDWTRLVSMTAARDTFRNSWELLRKGTVDVDGFMKANKMHMLEPGDRIKFAQLVEAQELEAAETLMQRRWTDITMFEYDQMNRPEAMNSGIGKVFGQFSTYPFSYLEFVKRGIKGEGAFFLSKLAISTTAMASFYGDILGMENMVNHKPWETAMFSGGPIGMAGISAVNDFNNFIQNPSTGTFNKGASNLIKIGIPYYGIARSTLKAFEEFNEADYQAGIINLLGATVNEDAFSRQF